MEHDLVEVRVVPDGSLDASISGEQAICSV